MNKIKYIYLILLKYFSSNIGKQIKSYVSIYIVIWLFHLVLISIVSYFHLLLNHNISTIGDWIVDRGWTLIIISKLVVSIVLYQFLKLRTDYFLLLKNYFKNAIQWPRQEMYICLIFLLMALGSLGSLKYNSALIFEVDRIILSLVGTFLFFAFDYVFLVVINLIYPVKESNTKLKRLVLFSFLFYVFTYVTFQYEQVISLKLFAYFYLLLYVGIWRRPSWTLPLIFLMVFIIPSFTFLGLDPVWGNSFTIFKMMKPISTFSIFILVFFAVGYLQYRLKNKTEYIFRE